MKTLVVYAHPNPKSFNHALFQTLVVGLREAGHEVRVRDLYGEGFDPVLSAADLADTNAGKGPGEDVRREQESVLWAEALVFVYPLWWFDRPALLKGWFDRVFTKGFAFRYTPKGMEGLLRHHKAMVIVTTGGTVHDFNVIGARDQILRPTTDGTLRFCGIHRIVDKIFFAIPLASEEQRRAVLEEVRELARMF